MEDYQYNSDRPWNEYESYIKYVTIEDGVTRIGRNAFANCYNFTSITIPKSVTLIKEDAFWYTKNLSKTNYTGDITSWCKIYFDGSTANPMYYSHNFYINNIEIKDLVISNDVTTIGEYAFYNCKGFTSVTIGNNVTSIGEYAFANCKGLTSVTIGNSVTSIGALAFYGCSSLTSITIPNSVTSIGGSAFSSCKGLTLVTLGNSITSIGEAAFYDCNDIQEVFSFASVPPAAASCDLNQATAILYVPAEYLEKYSNTVWWEDFAQIRAIGSDWNVTFVDWDSTTLATMKVPDGEAATAPADPTREGYTFIGWDQDFSRVIEDMIITAQYQINRYQVRFFDWDNTLLKTDSVDYQSAATAPNIPTREGYTFMGWNKDFSSITANLDVYAQYEEGVDKNLTIVFSAQNHNEISIQTITIRIPLAPEIEGFTFLGWQPVATLITDTITIQAIYEAHTPSATEEVYTNPANPAQKLLRNGQVYILQDGKTYTITGQRL